MLERFCACNRADAHCNAIGGLRIMRLVPIVTLCALAACDMQKTELEPAPETAAAAVFILAGQSNMAGHGRIDEVPQRYELMPSNITFHDFTQTFDRSAYRAWHDGKDLEADHDFLFPRSPGRFGPERGFAARLNEATPGRDVILIKWALGGTGMAEWSPDWAASDFAERSIPAVRGPLYRKALSAVRDVEIERPYEYRGLLWFQGENDARSLEAAESYGENLSRLIEAWRRDTGVEDLPLFIGMINPESDRHAFVDVVQAEIERFAREDPDTIVVPTVGLTKYEDGIHYDSQGQIELGIRFGEAVLAIDND